MERARHKKLDAHSHDMCTIKSGKSVPQVSLPIYPFPILYTSPTLFGAPFLGGGGGGGGGPSTPAPHQ
jgi:hypothetical protein